MDRNSINPTDQKEKFVRSDRASFGVKSSTEVSKSFKTSDEKALLNNIAEISKSEKYHDFKQKITEVLKEEFNRIQGEMKISFGDSLKKYVKEQKMCEDAIKEINKLNNLQDYGNTNVSRQNILKGMLYSENIILSRAVEKVLTTPEKSNWFKGSALSEALIKWSFVEEQIDQLKQSETWKFLTQEKWNKCRIKLIDTQDFCDLLHGVALRASELRSRQTDISLRSISDEIMQGYEKAFRECSYSNSTHIKIVQDRAYARYAETVLNSGIEDTNELDTKFLWAQDQIKQYCEDAIESRIQWDDCKNNINGALDFVYKSCREAITNSGIMESENVDTQLSTMRNQIGQAYEESFKEAFSMSDQIKQACKDPFSMDDKIKQVYREDCIKKIENVLLDDFTTENMRKRTFAIYRVFIQNSGIEDTNELDPKFLLAQDLIKQSYEAAIERGIQWDDCKNNINGALDFVYKSCREAITNSGIMESEDVEEQLNQIRQAYEESFKEAFSIRDEIIQAYEKEYIRKVQNILLDKSSIKTMENYFYKLHYIAMRDFDLQGQEADDVNKSLREAHLRINGLYDKGIGSGERWDECETKIKKELSLSNHSSPILRDSSAQSNETDAQFLFTQDQIERADEEVTRIFKVNIEWLKDLVECVYKLENSYKISIRIEAALNNNKQILEQYREELSKAVNIEKCRYVLVNAEKSTREYINSIHPDLETISSYLELIIKGDSKQIKEAMKHIFSINEYKDIFDSFPKHINDTLNTVDKRINYIPPHLFKTILEDAKPFDPPGLREKTTDTGIIANFTKAIRQIPEMIAASME